MLDAILLIAAVLINGALLLRLLTTASLRPTAHHLCWPSLLMTLWALCCAMRHIVHLPLNLSQPLISGIFTTATCTAISIVWFCGHFPQPTRGSHRLTILVLVLGIPWLFFAVLPFLPVLLITSNGDPGLFAESISYAYAAWFLLCGGISIMLLMTRMRITVGVKRIQMRFMLLGLTLSLLGVILDLLFPDFDSALPLMHYTPLFTLLTMILITYAVIKYPLTGLSGIMQSGVAYLLTTVLISLLYIVFDPMFTRYVFTHYDIPYDFSGLIVSALVAFCFFPLWWTIRYLLMRFFKNQYDYRQSLQDISNIFVLGRERSTLTEALLATITHTVNPRLLVVYYPKNGAGLLCQAGSPLDTMLPPAITPADALYRLAIRHKDIVITEDIARSTAVDAPLALQLADAGVELLAPLLVGEELRGLLVLGIKSSGNAYTLDDLSFLRILARQAAIALENACHYEELRYMNATLEQRIQERTHELHQSFSELRKAETAKDVFLAMLSHELLTPITSILGWAEVARESHDTAFTERALEVIEQNAYRQKRLVAELLDMSRLIHGKLVLCEEACYLWDLVEYCTDGLTPLINEHQHRLVLQPPSNPLPIIADPTRIQQAISNLLTNAIKFTANGGVITISGAARGETALLTITDTGRGIPAEELENIFALFRQVPTVDDTGGLGMGLALVKGIVELHNGRVTAASGGPEHGSTFTIELPLEPALLVTPAYRRVDEEIAEEIGDLV